MTSHPVTDAITAPQLMALDSRGARILAAVFVAAACVPVIFVGDENRSTPLHIVSIVVASIGVAGIVMTWPDPMPMAATLVVAVSVPLGCLLTCLAIPVQAGNANQLNVVGVGVAVCAFLCVRGRTAAAWCAQSGATVVLVGWSAFTGQGVLLGVFISGPNLAILGIATYFAIVVRPAAATIARLRTEAVAHTEQVAAAEARLAERDRAQELLREVAWPALTAIARGDVLSDGDVAAIRLTEARLRDSVRARSLSVDAVIAATWRARSRGVEVVLLDDGRAGIDSAVGETFQNLLCGWLDGAVDGTVTARIHPPDRPVWGSIVAIDSCGSVCRIHLDAGGAVTGSALPPELGGSKGGLIIHESSEEYVDHGGDTF